MNIELGILTEFSYIFIEDLQRDQTHKFAIHDEGTVVEIKIFYDGHRGIIHFFKDGEYFGHSEY